MHSPHCLAMVCAKLLIKDTRFSSLAKIVTVYIRDVIIPKTHGMTSPGYIVHSTTFIMIYKKKKIYLLINVICTVCVIHTQFN